MLSTTPPVDQSRRLYPACVRRERSCGAASPLAAPGCRPLAEVGCLRSRPVLVLAECEVLRAGARTPSYRVHLRVEPVLEALRCCSQRACLCGYPLEWRSVLETHSASHSITLIRRQQEQCRIREPASSPVSDEKDDCRDHSCDMLRTIDTDLFPNLETMTGCGLRLFLAVLEALSALVRRWCIYHRIDRTKLMIWPQTKAGSLASGCRCSTASQRNSWL